MKISEVLKLENNNNEHIILHLEGLFWRAYELSAYRFVSHIKAYQITKKYIKNVKSDIVYCGFPQNALSNILKLVENKKVEKTEKQINIAGFEPENDEYEKWKDGIPNEQIPEGLKLSESSYSGIENNILNQIRNFQVITKSPIECQQFLIEIQNQINGTTLWVYKVSYDLLIQIFELTKHFNREYKYTVGEKLKNEMLELLLNVYRANSQYQKKEILQKGRENIEIVRVLLRIVKDMKQISVKQFTDINVVIENVSKQLAGWQKSCK